MELSEGYFLYFIRKKIRKDKLNFIKKKPSQRPVYFRIYENLLVESSWIPMFWASHRILVSTNLPLVLVDDEDLVGLYPSAQSSYRGQLRSCAFHSGLLGIGYPRLFLLPCWVKKNQFNCIKISIKSSQVILHNWLLRCNFNFHA